MVKDQETYEAFKLRAVTHDLQFMLRYVLTTFVIIAV
jgi:hypothetical protein